MPNDMKICRIKSIRSAAIFDNFNSSTEMPDFSNQNLIYGFNGSGKSILSRLFASLGHASPADLLPTGCSYSIRLNDGVDLGPFTEHPIADDILVFNTDFVAQNLSWTDAKAKPVFYLGKEQSEIPERLAKLKGELNALENAKASSTQLYATQQSAFSQFKTDQARIIATELGLGRTYNAPNFKGDCDNFEPVDDEHLTDDALVALRSLVRAEVPLPRLKEIDEIHNQLTGLRQSSQSLVKSSFSARALQELQGHESMVGWVMDGFQYHRQNDLEHCLFCGENLTQDRLEKLSEALDDKFEQLIRSVKLKDQELDDFRDSLELLENNLPRPNEISADLRGGFDDTCAELARLIKIGFGVVEQLRQSLRDKLERPQSVQKLRIKCMDPAHCADWDAKIGASIKSLAEFVISHNVKYSDFEATKAKASDRLKLHLLKRVVNQYSDKDAACTAAEKAKTADVEKYDKQAEEIAMLEESLKQHAVAADKMNTMIKGYLGHDELEFRALDRGYEIRRNGVALDGPLSEGEKTAIALCYFMTCLEADGKQVKNLIVVLDDPISSLDTRALSYAVAMVKALCGDARQLFIFTHNLYFMNELKKWIGTKQDKDKEKLYFLEVTKSPDSGVRVSNLVKLPKFIRDYESEYQYLFHLILQFDASGGGDEKHIYVMPNALRKVLDTFLAFKVPGSMGLKPKIHKLSKDYADLDSVKLIALEGLLQLESHADSLDDLVTLSPLTVEEIFDATTALLHVIKIADPSHHKQMLSICS